MKNFRKITAAVLVFVLAFCLCGCSVIENLFGGSAEFAPTESSIFIKKDRTITGAEIESFDNSQFDTPRYSETELLTFAEDLVKAYNKEQVNLEFAYASDVAEEEDVTLPVAIQSLTVSGKTATLLIDYEDYKDYLQFNGTSYGVPVQNLIVGTVADGVSSDLTFENMQAVEKGAVAGAADPAEIMEKTKYMLVAVTGETLVSVEGTVKYISDGITYVNENTVRVNGSNQYIIFK